MTMRVATFSMNERMLAASLQTQARMVEMQIQEASGSVSSDYGGLGTDTRKLINLEVTLTRSKSYEKAASEAMERTEVMYDALTSVSDLLSSFRAELVALQSTDATDSARSNFVETAQGYLEELASLLNTQYNGEYLFAGGATSTTPVDLTAFAVTDAVTFDISYYQGGSNLAAVMTGEGRNITYGVNADDVAFETAFRSLGLIAGAGSVPDDDMLNDALELIIEAVDGTATVQGQLSVKASALERVETTQQDLQSFLETSISSIRDVDVVAVAAKLTSYETQLQASYAALAKVQSLNLLDYVR